ncbi:hypothetical protein LguiA_018505 [Lonicera macranthoides]
MGKSPGKWIKTVLFGKKSSKSNFSKEKASVDAKAPTGGLTVNPPVILDQTRQTTGIRGEHNELERGTSANLPCGVDVVLPGTLGVDGNVTMVPNPANDAELTKLEQAATKAQAAFRGYLARRAFRALKGIIRLQALVRGHLVRRQAVATLRCMQAIVKFQALVRGRRVRISDVGCEVLKKCNLEKLLDVKQVDFVGVSTFLRSEKLSRNVFVTKLVASLPTAMPLSLQYDIVEPNAAWNWLERWSFSRFWEPLARQKKILEPKPKRKQNNIQTEETETGKPKRGVWKVSAKNIDSNSLHSSEFEKPKRNPRKVPIPQNESGQDPPQIELEKVKRNLRKVSVPATAASEKSEVVTEKPLLSLKKVSSSPSHEVTGTHAVAGTHASEKLNDKTIEKLNDKTIEGPNQPVVEPPKPLTEAKPVDVVCNDNNPTVEIHSQESNDLVETGPTVKEELSTKEEQASKDNTKTRRRRSLPVKSEYTESVPQNAPTVPSYMAATESAKAKLRAQESLRLAEEGVENGSIRRHSLPTSTNGKMSSPSPRMQKPLQTNGKGGNKSGRLVSTKDGWRR